MPNEFIPCGGCGAESPNDRCIGCMHNFGEQTELEQHAKQVTEQWSAVISTLGVKAVEHPCAILFPRRFPASEDESG